ncbi:MULTISPECIES: recombinase family protein [unclassified Sphingomonas]|uniref:recombinase family protein n=1 Tax=unclassified Sphingomonas TaxID=196159 RepID=UPI00286AB1BC|nr:MULTISPECIES: recombinase family protein [unclassified Sphingomonas]
MGRAGEVGVLTFRCLQRDAIDTARSDGKPLLNILANFAEFELDIRRERQKDGIEKAKASGVYKGRLSCCRSREYRDEVFLEPEDGDATTEVQPRVQVGGSGARAGTPSPT